MASLKGMNVEALLNLRTWHLLRRRQKKFGPAIDKGANQHRRIVAYINRHWVSSSLGNNCRRSPYQRLVVTQPDYDTFGGSLCTSSGHSSSTSSRISSETSGRPSVSSRNLCSRSKSSCTMIWSQIIRGAKIRFDFTFSVLPLFVLFSWRTNHLSSSASDPQLARFVIGRVFLSHEETSEIPLSSSIVLRRFPPISDDRERTRSIW